MSLLLAGIVVTVDEIEKRLAARGRMLATARKAERGIFDAAADLAVEAADAGKSEYLISRLLGVDRMTVRKWVGKR